MTYLINGVRRIVIDVINNNPLRSFSHLPLTVSTKVEGWLQEAWFRMDPSVRAEDLIQRMPYSANHNVYKDRKIINRLVRRRELFRNEGRCLSWKKTTYEKKWDLHLIEEMHQKPNPADPNSTRHLKDLSSNQTLALKDETYVTGKHLARAGRRTLRGEERAKKNQGVQERRASRPATSAYAGRTLDNPNRMQSLLATTHTQQVLTDEWAQQSQLAANSSQLGHDSGVIASVNDDPCHDNPEQHQTSLMRPRQYPVAKEQHRCDDDGMWAGVGINADGERDMYDSFLISTDFFDLVATGLQRC